MKETEERRGRRQRRREEGRKEGEEARIVKGPGLRASLPGIYNPGTEDALRRFSSDVGCRPSALIPSATEPRVASKELLKKTILT